MQCKAKSKRSGKRCKKDVVKGKEVCHIHGGKSLEGAESGTWVDGSSSKYGAIFSGDALEHYKVAREDDRYLELREDLAVLDTLFVEELRAAKLGQGGALWQELGKVWSQFESADPTRDATSAGRALRRMGELINEGVGRHAAQTHALEIHEKKRRTSETERKRIVEPPPFVPLVEGIVCAG